MNFVLNWLLIPRYSYIGAAIATFSAELAVLVVILWAGRKFIPFPIFHRDNLKYVWATLVMAVAVLVVIRWGASSFLQILIATSVGALVYGSMLLWQKDDLLDDISVYAKLKKCKNENL